MSGRPPSPAASSDSEDEDAVHAMRRIQDPHERLSFLKRRRNAMMQEMLIARGRVASDTQALAWKHHRLTTGQEEHQRLERSQQSGAAPAPSLDFRELRRLGGQVRKVRPAFATGSRRWGEIAR